MQTLPGKRIAVVGTSGCGKSYVAQALSQRLNIPYISNDEIIWAPNWQPSPKEGRLPRFVELMSGDAWTFDGNFCSLRDPEDRHTMSRIDTLIWLDLPRHVVFWQVLQRTWKRCWYREPLWHGNRESWRQSFFSRDSIVLWSMQTYRLRQQQFTPIFEQKIKPHPHLILIRLRSRKEIEQWLEQIPKSKMSS